MNPTQYTLLEQMRITESEIQRRKELLAISDHDVAVLAQAQDWIHHAVEDIVDEFYRQQTAVEEIAHLIGDAATLSRLRSAMRQYVLDLFSGDYDLNYVNGRLRIGMVHKRIGVEPKYYLSATHLLRRLIQEALSRDHGDEECRKTMVSLDKLFFFDVEFVFDTYIRSLMSELETSKEMAERYASNLEQQVAERTQQLRELSRRDSLTGVFNRRAFDEFARRDLANAKRHQHPLALVYFDVDDFKCINDCAGHMRGDEILRGIGKVMLDNLREGDIPSRVGGDEFCVLLTNADQAMAVDLGRRLNAAIRQVFADVRLSIGIALTGPREFVDIETLIAQADAAMYQAKDHPHTHIVTTQDGESAPVSAEISQLPRAT